MKFFMNFVCIILFVPLFNSSVILPEDNDLYEGSTCQNSEENGVCTKKSECPQAKTDVEKYGHHNLTQCGFVGLIQIVCCPIAHPSRVKGDNVVKDKSKKFCDDLLKNFSTVVSPQIVNGRDANLGEFPYVAALGFYDITTKTYKFECAGSLISNKHVVTAAHCFFSPKGVELKFVRLGVTDISENIINPVVDYNVKKFIVHPNYNNRKLYNDIALIELEKEVTFSANIYPTCLYTTKDVFPEELIISGWGFVNSSEIKSNVLQKAVVSFTKFQKCKDRYEKSYNYNLLESQICAEDSKSDTCEGDSGGPLQIKNSSFPFLVGITSFGPPSKCEASSVPSVYTSISHYVQWIESVVWT